MIVVVAVSTQVADPAPRVAQRLGCRDHVERNGQRAAFVNVIQPEFRPRKLPLHVAVLLHVISQGTLVSLNTQEREGVILRMVIRNLVVCVMVRASDLISRYREFDSRPVHCWVVYVNSTFHSSGIGKPSTSLLAGVSAGRVHLCRVADNTVIPCGR